MLLHLAACGSSLIGLPDGGRGQGFDGGASDSGVEDAGADDGGTTSGDAGGQDAGALLLLGAEVAVGPGPSLLAVDDFNADGHADVVLLFGRQGRGGHTAQLFVGDGHGGLSPSGPPLETNVAPRGVAAADFTGDGLLDLAIGACADDGSTAELELFAGDNRGRFAAPQVLSLTICPFALATADIDGDGQPDLITAGPGPFVTGAANGETRIYRGGSAALRLLAALPGTLPALGVTAVDLNGDRRPDLAVTHADGTLDLELGDGRGGFASQTPLTPGGGPFRAIVHGDFDGDGRPDLALASPAGSSLAVLLNRSTGFASAGSGSEGGPLTFAVQLAAGARDPVALAFADLEGMGRQTPVASDASAYYQGASQFVLDGSGRLTNLPMFTNGGGYGVGVSDFDEDGRIDLVLSESQSDALVVLLGRKNLAPADGGPFQIATHTQIPTVPNHGGPIIHHPDLINVTFSDDTLAADREAYAGYLVGSPWLSEIGAEYGVGLGQSRGVRLKFPAPTTVNDGDIGDFLAALIADGGLPAPEAVDSGIASQVYAVYYPRGTSISGKIGTSCNSYGGYHEEAQTLEGQPFAYAVIPTCGDESATQVTVSHELAEASTDPLVMSTPAFTASGDTNNAFIGELGDLCTFYTMAVGPYVAQRIWSNAAALAGTQPCIPAPAAEPYVSAAPPSPGIYVIAPGQSETIAITAWSTSATEPFSVSAAATSVNDLPVQFQPTASLDHSLLTNGERALLTISVPSGTKSGYFGAVTLFSGLADDNFGYWPILVQVQ